jgi:hypothetical protein
MTICIRLALKSSFLTIVALVYLGNDGFFVLLEPIEEKPFMAGATAPQ